MNPEALVSVKLVAEPGVGTVAAGVAKAYADLITISGYDGGTGASPLSSIKYAGTPWELGLAETHQTLRVNDLRHRVRLQTDGGLKTGLDVVKAAIIGAESFGFGTAPMVALGCKYLRICHLNNCATGVATQHNVLRSKYFTGLPEMVINYFRFVARGGARDPGRARRAQPRRAHRPHRVPRRSLAGVTPRQRKLDLAPILSSAGLAADAPQFCTTPSNAPFDKGELAERMVRDMLPAIEAKSGGEWRYELSNFNRSIGARLSGRDRAALGQLRHGGRAAHRALQRQRRPELRRVECRRPAPVSRRRCQRLRRQGHGGRAASCCAIRARARFVAKDTIIMGNTCLYGATGGELFAAGVAGERFAVRNSGALAVIEGAGDHCCEYMTGGVVCVLGRTGVNFGAGFTGGFAYVLDLERNFVDRYNHELIDISRIHAEAMQSHVQHLRGAAGAARRRDRERLGRGDR